MRDQGQRVCSQGRVNTVGYVRHGVIRASKERHPLITVLLNCQDAYERKAQYAHVGVLIRQSDSIAVTCLTVMAIMY